jgi:small-conductance mechanosensitive channel
MATKQKLTEEELKQIQEVQQQNSTLRQELGQIGMFEKQIQEMKQNVDKFYQDFTTKEKELTQKLNSKYGVGQIDLNEGVFISDTSEDTQTEDSSSK